MKAVARKRIKRLWNRKSRQAETTCRRTTKLIGRKTGGQWVEKRYSTGGLVID